MKLLRLQFIAYLKSKIQEERLTMLSTLRADFEASKMKYCKHLCTVIQSILCNHACLPYLRWSDWASWNIPEHLSHLEHSHSWYIGLEWNWLGSHSDLVHLLLTQKRFCFWYSLRSRYLKCITPCIMLLLSKI